MQIERVLKDDRLRVSKVSWKFRIPTMYKFAVIYPCNLKVAYFLTVSIVFSVYKQTLRLNNLKTRTAMNTRISVFIICVEAIIYLLLYDLHDCTFKKDFEVTENFKTLEVWRKLKRVISYRLFLKTMLCKIFWEKLKYQTKLNKTEKILITVFAYFFSVNVKKFVLQRRLDTRLCPHLILRFC